MKRMLGIFMALLLFAAPAIAHSASVEGDWELISITIEGYTYDNLAQQGMSMTMRLAADRDGRADAQRRGHSLRLAGSGRKNPD